MNSRTRTALTAGVLAVALGLGATVQASAGTPRSVSGKPSESAQASAAAPRSVSGTPGQAVTRVADFYGAYIDAKGDYTDPDVTLATALRKHYLTPDFAKRLAAWEKKNAADGVLRAQNVPTRWTVTDNGTMGHSHEVIVTLTFGSGETTQKTRLFVLVERYNHISAIETTSTR
ncbi:hypothetical protein ACFS5L_33245 [Streptomyces phyllanthi]|uniref:Nuclear transport factor 2 family protein n=1 Tax=Streptomyces phyllanthi TaxID=1803180 RepID=A0A5N8WGZ1_9ACTN|nr:hypothetical protein [Streptomyces phyllanthi]MPY45768.1 hypothetical protein [Streptomyces phyllanthi]